MRDFSFVDYGPYRNMKINLVFLMVVSVLEKEQRRGLGSARVRDNFIMLNMVAKKVVNQNKFEIRR